MEFLGVGYQELLLILVLMLVVVGPERLPGMAYQIGRAVRTLQSYARAVRSEFSEEIAYLDEQYKTVKGEIEPLRNELRDQQRSFESEMRDVSSTLNQPLIEPPSNVVSINPAAASSNAATPPAEAAASAPSIAPAAAETTEQPGSAAPPAPPLVF